jgi:outer membrane protein assembly factor BamD
VRNGIAFAPALLAGLLAAWGCASAPHAAILPADEEYTQGMEAFGRERWSNAAEHLNRLVLNYPDDPRAAQARYLLGQANFHSEEYPSAAQDFERFQQDFPADSLADDALYWAGRSHEAQALKPELDQSETQRALSEYSELRRQYPASPFGDEARDRVRLLRDRLAAKEYLIARYYFKQELYKATEIYVRSLIEQYPESSYVAPAYLILAQAYQAQGRVDDAQRIRDTLIEQFPDSPEARQVGGTPRESGGTSSAATAASPQSGGTGEAR